MTQWVARLRRQLSDTSVRQYCILFWAIMDRTLKGRSPCRDISPPTQVKTEVVPPSVHEYNRLLSVVAGTRDELNVRLIGDCGMRRGEIHGLTYREGLRTAGYIYIEQTATQSVEGWVLTSPKSRRGRRHIAVPGYIQQLIWNRMMDMMLRSHTTASEYMSSQSVWRRFLRPSWTA